MDLFATITDPFATSLEISAPALNPDASSPRPSDSSSRSDVLMLDEDTVEEDDEDLDYARAQGFASYDLRPSARDGKTVFMTWYDIDKSGDYDPRFEGEKRIRKEQRSAFVRKDSPTGDGEGIERQANGIRLSKLAARQHGCSMTVTLQLTSEALKALASTIPDNWPGEEYNILSDEYIQQEALELAFSGEGRSLRRRPRERSKNQLAYSYESPVGIGIPDPFGKEPDLIGHPAARGCKACRRDGVICPLLEEGSTWPCHACVSYDLDCELITPPITRATCETCTTKKLPCSYVHNKSDSAQPCAQCMESGSHCVAGPGFEGIKDRISYDRDWSKPRPADPQGRPRITCAQCRGQNKKCSLKKKTDNPPCDGCLSSGGKCTFELVRHQPRRLVALPAVAPSSAKSSNIPSGSEDLPLDAQIINTALCHPIELMSDDEYLCNWCCDGSDGIHNSKYGICGYGWKDVMVRPSIQYSSIAWEEICGGHAAQGVPQSIMCETCCMKRLRIMQCVEHEMRPLTELLMLKEGDDCGGQELTAETLYEIDFQGPYDRLEGDDNLLPTDRFCNLCPSIATFKCCSIQEADLYGEPISCELPDAEGCGLMLCEDCKNTHDAHIKDGLPPLDGAIYTILTEKDAKLPDSEAIWHLGIRADAEFLLQEGHLMKKILLNGNDSEDGVAMDLD
jgi:hypothetical protein